ncbi:hypothetical protein MHU86_23645 [Fragilaria crotonensis]|nr:hypothetical protein MHU86_23645 [Fragilaria crotonensis]
MAEQSTVKRSMKQFPMIPPLPSSKGLPIDKENVTETPYRLKDNRAKRATPQSRRKPLQENGNDVFRSPGIQSSQYNRGRILRTGETVQTLFCLSAKTSREHLQLCQQIVDGPLSDDPSAWCRALKVACMQIDASQTSDNSFSHGDLMRLHRRAKARFSLLDNTSAGNEEQVLQIWLSYAEAQGKYASPEEARAVYRLIQNQGFGAKLSSFYVSFAKFESNFNVSKAIDVINSGIENGAEPIEILRTTLMKLDQLDKKVDSSQRESLVGCAPSGSPLQGHAKRVSLVPPLPTESRKRARRQAVSPKGRAFAENHETDEKAMLEDSNMSTGTVSLSLENELKTVSRDGPSSLSRQVMSQNHTAEAGVVELEFKSAAISQKEGTAQSNPSANDAKAAAKKTRNRLLSKVPRLKPVGLTGGAKRLTPGRTH